MAKAIMPVVKDLKLQINKTNDQLASQYRMMSSAHNRYNLLFRQTHEMETIYIIFLTIIQELFNHTSRHFTENTSTIY